MREGQMKCVCTQCGVIQFTKSDNKCFMCMGDLITPKRRLAIAAHVTIEQKDWLTAHRDTTGETIQQLISFLIDQEMEKEACQNPTS